MCRQTLKWTYAFAYYLERNNQTEIFEDNQKDLEMAVENLSEMFEKPTEQLSELKVDMMDKTSYCNQRRIVLLDDTAKNLKDGESTEALDGLSIAIETRSGIRDTNMNTVNWKFTIEI